MLKFRLCFLPMLAPTTSIHAAVHTRCCDTESCQAKMSLSLQHHGIGNWKLVFSHRRKAASVMYPACAMLAVSSPVKKEEGQKYES